MHALAACKWGSRLFVIGPLFSVSTRGRRPPQYPGNEQKLCSTGMLMTGLSYYLAFPQVLFLRLKNYCINHASVSCGFLRLAVIVNVCFFFLWSIEIPDFRKNRHWVISLSIIVMVDNLTTSG